MAARQHGQRLARQLVVAWQLCWLLVVAAAAAQRQLLLLHMA
jgi:hypothetical protein